jgi:hypothetical protein
VVGTITLVTYSLSRPKAEETKLSAKGECKRT